MPTQTGVVSWDESTVTTLLFTVQGSNAPALVPVLESSLV